MDKLLDESLRVFFWREEGGGGEGWEVEVVGWLDCGLTYPQLLIVRERVDVH